MSPRPDALALMRKINKEHGEGTVVVGTDMTVAARFPSGSLSLDIALGGGWPGNQWVEVIGMESHGKTFLVLKTIAANQARDASFTTLWIAAEHYDVEQAAALGVDNDRVIVVATQEMEFAYQTMLDFAASRSVDAIVLDSYPALIPDEEARKDMDESVMAIGARLTGKFFRKAGSATKRSLVEAERPMLGIIINQFRDAIGQFSPQGTPKTTPGGKAKNFAYYVRVEVRRDEWIDEARPGKGKVRVGQSIKARTIKNKSAAPQQVASIDAYFRDAPYLGFTRGDYDEVKELITYALIYDVITRGGANFYLGPKGEAGTRVIKGREALTQAVGEDLDLRENMRADILAAASAKEVASITEDEVAAAAGAGERTVARRPVSAA